MKRFLLSITTVFILFLSMAFTFDSNGKNDYFNCTVDDVILNLSESVERIKFTLPVGGINNVVLCDLKVGATYDLHLIDVTSACGIPPEFEGNPVGSETYLQITPTSTCYDLSVNNFCNFKKPVRLSVSEQGTTAGSNILTGADMIPITTNTNYTAAELIEDVFIGGGCFDVSNVTSIGSLTGIGAFANGINSIGFDEGVVISSGNIATVSGPNNSESAGSATGGGSDPDLQQLNSQNIFDATGIEFDFAPTLPSVDFRFVFGSEEYCEFVNANVNDVFGFFISGPGITGPFSNNSTNLALIPMTNIPISIDDVNNNSNPTYFVPNSANCGGITNAADIQFDGYTIALTATANVIPCETYHIKLVVGDGGDAIYDSAVFLEAGSFNAGGQATVSAVNASTGTNVVYEDCGDALITFTRQTGDLSLPLLITYTIDPASTATNGVDYTGLPSSITIPAGQTEVTISLTIFSDGIIEGLETIIINMDNSCSCVNSTATIEILDVPPLIVDPMLDQFLCGPETVTLASGISGGVSPFTYLWSTGATTAVISEFVPSTMTYTVTVMDACGNSIQDDVMIEVGTTPTAFISGVGDICPPNNPLAVIQIDFTGTGPWDVFYAIDGVVQAPLMGIVDNPYILSVSEIGTYTISQLMVNGCPGDASGLAVITETIIAPVSVGTDISCWGFNDGSINVFPIGGQNPYSYNWSNPIANGDSPTNLPPGDYTVTVYDDNGCTGLTSITLEEPSPILLTTVENSVDCSDPNSGSIDLTVEGGIFPYSTIWSNGTNGEDPTGLAVGTYTVTVTDLGGCFVTLTTIIENNASFPSAVANAPDSLSCSNPQISINGNGSSLGIGYTYLWTTTNGTIVNNETTLNPTISSTGTYQIMVTDPIGCTQIDTVIVGENITPPLADAGLEMIIDCGTTIVSLNGGNSSSGSSYTYEWTTSGGNIVSGGNTLNPLVDAAGGYILTVTNTANGCTSTSSTNVIISADIPAANAGISQSLTCGILEVTLDGSGSEVGTNITYLWTTIDGNIISGNNSLNPIVNEVGIYQLLVTDTDNGCTAISTVDVGIDDQPPVAVANAPNLLTCSTSIVSINGNGSSSGINFTYHWTTIDGNIVSGENSFTPEVDEVGVYQILVTNLDNGCTETASVDVLINTNLPSADAGVAADLTCIANQISLNGSASIGNNFIYLWTTNDGNIVSGNEGLTPIINSIGTYQLLVTDTDNGCTAISTVLVEEDLESPDVLVDIPSILTCTTLSVSLSASNNGIGSDYTYLWTTNSGNIVSGENGLTPTVNASGNYILETTNTINGCSSIISVDVLVDNQEPIANAGPSMEVTCGTTEVNLDGSGSASGAGITYLWITSDGDIVSGGNTSSPLIGSIGTYQLLVTNTLTGCTAISSVFVGEDVEDPVAVAGTSQTLSCASTSAQLYGNGSSLGSNFVYEWTTSDGNIVSGGNTLTPDINAPGDYQIQVTNTNNGCTATELVSVFQDSNAPIAEAGMDDLLNCNITNLVLDGGGSSQGLEFTYEWTTLDGNIIIGGTTLNPEINAPGEYQLIVTNVVNGCSSISSLVIDIDDEEPTAEAGLSQFLSCANSTLTLDGTGSSVGVDYTYQWITSNGNIISGENSLNPEVNATGAYELIVTSLINGCTISDGVEIMQDSSLPVANAGSGFEITCQVFEGTLNGSSSTINNDIIFEWTTMDGNIVSGANTLTPLVDLAGIYQLTLTNIMNGCTAISFATVIENNETPDVEAGATMELNCNNENLSIVGSTVDDSTDLIYEWITLDGNIISGNNDLMIDVDSVGTYQLMITNTYTGCFSTDEVIVTSNYIEPVANAGITDELNCTQITANLDGNESSSGSNFIYHWTTTNGNIVAGENTLNPEVNMPGNYQILVTDLANGCTASESVSISQNITSPNADAGTANDLTCSVESFDLDGSNSSSGLNFDYLWTTIDGNILQGSNTLNPSINEPGIYEIQVTNTINNCVSSAEVIVDQNLDTPSADGGLQALLTCSITETQLDGDNSSSGNNITYQWTTNNGNIISNENTTTPTIGEIGTYELIVTNVISGCTSNAFVEVVEDVNIPNAIAIPMGVLTCDENTVSLNGTGSSVGSNFEYQWSTINGNITSGGTSVSSVVDETGQYTLVVVNLDNGCANEVTITVDEDVLPPLAAIDQTGNTSLDCDISSIVLDGSGSQPFGSVSYSWSTIGGNILSGVNTANPEVDDDGEYILLITNLINGCTETQSIFIDQDLSVPQVDIAEPLILTCDLTETILDAGNSSQGNYSYQWTTGNGYIVSGDSSLIPVVNQIGTYLLVVTDLGSNCTNESSITVIENVTPPIAEAGTAVVLDCQTTSVTLDGSGSSFGPNFIYQWSTNNGNFIGGTTTISTEVDLAGNYNLDVINIQNGCTSSDFVLVNENDNAPNGIIYTIDQPECHGDQGSISIETIDGGTAPYVYSIDGINYYSGHIFTIEAGDYTLYAQDALGCETQVDFEIPELEPIEIFLTSEATINLGDDYQIEALTNILSNQIASISWTPSHNLSCDNCLNPKVEQLFDNATYTLTIVNNNGCKISAKITINVDKARDIYIPNVFTPNGDGENDIFMIYAGDLSQIKQVNTFMIYDRWGETIFRAADFVPMDPQNGWDGTFKGETMNPQVFVYWAEVEFIDGLKVLFKGDVALRK